jgi:hypothetical protein
VGCTHQLAELQKSPSKFVPFDLLILDTTDLLHHANAVSDWYADWFSFFCLFFFVAFALLVHPHHFFFPVPRFVCWGCLVKPSGHGCCIQTARWSPKSTQAVCSVPHRCFTYVVCVCVRMCVNNLSAFMRLMEWMLIIDVSFMVHRMWDPCATRSHMCVCIVRKRLCGYPVKSSLLCAAKPRIHCRYDCSHGHASSDYMCDSIVVTTRETQASLVHVSPVCEGFVVVQTPIDWTAWLNLGLPLSYYNPGIHMAALSLPNEFLIAGGLTLSDCMPGPSVWDSLARVDELVWRRSETSIQAAVGAVQSKSRGGAGASAVLSSRSNPTPVLNTVAPWACPSCPSCPPSASCDGDRCGYKRMKDAREVSGPLETSPTVAPSIVPSIPIERVPSIGNRIRFSIYFFTGAPWDCLFDVNYVTYVLMCSATFQLIGCASQNHFSTAHLGIVCTSSHIEIVRYNSQCVGHTNFYQTTDRRGWASHVWLHQHTHCRRVCMSTCTSAKNMQRIISNGAVRNKCYKHCVGRGL